MRDAGQQQWDRPGCNGIHQHVQRGIAWYSGVGFERSLKSKEESCCGELRFLVGSGEFWSIDLGSMAIPVYSSVEGCLRLTFRPQPDIVWQMRHVAADEQ